MFGLTVFIMFSNYSYRGLNSQTTVFWNHLLPHLFNSLIPTIRTLDQRIVGLQVLDTTYFNPPLPLQCKLRENRNFYQLYLLLYPQVPGRVSDM